MIREAVGGLKQLDKVQSGSSYWQYKWIWYMFCLIIYQLNVAPPWSNGNVLDHRSLPPVFEFQHGHIWRLFHLWLRLITFRGRSAHLAYHVHKSGHETSIIIIIYQLNVGFTYTQKMHLYCSWNLPSLDWVTSVGWSPLAAASYL